MHDNFQFVLVWVCVHIYVWSMFSLASVVSFLLCIMFVFNVMYLCGIALQVQNCTCFRNTSAEWVCFLLLEFDGRFLICLCGCSRNSISVKQKHSNTAKQDKTKQAGANWGMFLILILIAHVVYAVLPPPPPG